jgi:hypothetical protein
VFAERHYDDMQFVHGISPLMGFSSIHFVDFIALVVKEITPI